MHTDNCHNSLDFRNNPERSVPLRWDDEVEGEFSVELKVELEKSRGIIAVLATKINSLDANIEKISVEEEGQTQYRQCSRRRTLPHSLSPHYETCSSRKRSG